METIRNASDGALLSQIADGDKDALRGLYERFGRYALAVALRILGNRGEAEEIVQETFVQAWRQASRFDPTRGSAMTWIVAIARSRALDRLRSRSSAERIEAASEADPEPPPPSPSDVAEHRELQQRVSAALAALPADQRTALELAYFKGLTQSEIAEQLGDPLGTVKTRVRLGLAKLAALLGEAVSGVAR